MSQTQQDERSSFVIGHAETSQESDANSAMAYLEPRQRNPHDSFVVWGNSGRIGRIIDASYNEIYLFDARTLNFQQVSGGALRNLGYSMSEISRLTPMDLNPFNRGQFESMIAPLRRSEVEQLVFDSTHRRRDGSVYPCETRLQLSASESPPVFLAIVQDLTERHRAAESLRQSERRFHATFEQAAVGIAHVALNGRYLEVNRRLCEILGYPGEAIVKLRHAELTHIEDVEADSEQIAALMRGEIQTFASEKRYRRAAGDYVWVRVTVSLAFGERGEPDYFIFVVEDISERKHFERQVSQLNEQLLQRVLERTGELSAVNGELEAFSYSVSHDLRAPLRSIDGFSQALEEDYGDKLDEVGKTLLGRVRGASQRMAQLIDDLLNLSRITRTKMQPREVDLSELIHQEINILRERGLSAAVDFIVEPGVHVRGDPELLRHAICNLYGNAVKFTSKTAQPRIEFGSCETENGRACFVRDNGAGFDMAYAGRLFGAFQRLHSAAEFEGTGIGLVTVQRIIHRHGGRIWAEGEIDKGATFYFKLPDQSAD